MKVIEFYLSAKAKHPDIDDWLAESVVAEYGYDSLDAIQAIRACFVTDLPWEEFRVFEKVVLVLNDRLVFGEIVQDLDIKEIAYAVSILKGMFPENMFNDEISKYIAIEATQEGFIVLPEELEFAQRFIPVSYLTREQEQVQMAYLQEVADYKKMADGSDF
jgi:hypothetical protein